MKKLIAFIGSPHHNGSTGTLVKEIVKGAEKAGATANIYYLNDMDIKFCQGCKSCKLENGTCIITDDMKEVYKEFMEADAIIIGSPIYVCQVSAQTKVLFDRLYALLDGKLKPRFEKKKVVMVYSQGMPNINEFQSYFDINAIFLNKFGLEAIDTIIYAGSDEAKKKELLVRAYTAGELLMK